MNMIFSNETRHKYEYAVDPNADTAPARVIRMVGAEKCVLEIGSGPGSITRVLHEVNRCRITALEIDPEALKKVTPYCQRALPADLNDPDWPKLLDGELFDTVVAADVLEHLYDPLAALKAMRSLLSPNGSVIVSLPHVGHAAIVACLLDENFEYREWGLLDRTHIRFFGIKNMQDIFDQAGLKIISAEFVVKHPELTEFSQRWLSLSEDARRVALANPYGQVYQVVIKAVVENNLDGKIFLTDALPSVNIHGASSKNSSFMRSIARRHLSDETKHSIRSILSRIGIKL